MQGPKNTLSCTHSLSQSKMHRCFFGFGPKLNNSGFTFWHVRALSIFYLLLAYCMESLALGLNNALDMYNVLYTVQSFLHCSLRQQAWLVGHLFSYFCFNYVSILQINMQTWIVPKLKYIYTLFCNKYCKLNTPLFVISEPWFFILDGCSFNQAHIRSISGISIC